MTNPNKKENELEILLSTMGRTSLSFLSKMFPDDNFLNFNILIINQTTKDKLLTSGHKNIRVINSFEKGVSRSRNLALKNAKHEMILIADDDIVYKKGFNNTVLNAFKKEIDASIITFKASNLDESPYRDYSNVPHRHNSKSIKGVISWEIAVNVHKIRDFNIFFNEKFGLGSEFTTAEEYLFVRSAIENNCSVYFCKEYIVYHPMYNSGKDLGSDRIIYARAALNFKLHNYLAYFWLVNFMVFLVKSNYIEIRQIQSKFKIGLKGIKVYKKILKEELKIK